MAGDLHFDVTVEIPAGARNKYEMDYASNRIRLDRMLFTSTRYPADYGYVDNSLGRDDDPLDAMVLLQEPTFPGCVIRSRAVGMFLMRDEVGPDEKVICVMATDPRYAQVKDLDDLPSYELNEIEHFFQIYKETEPGKMVEKLRWAHREEAEEEVRNSLRRWKDHVAGRRIPS